MSVKLACSFVVVGQNMSTELALTHVTTKRSMKTVSLCSLACCECVLLTQVLAAQMLSCLVCLWVSGISYDTCTPSGQDWALILMPLAANTKGNILLWIQSPGTVLEFRMWYRTIYQKNLHCADFSFSNFSFGVLPWGCYSWLWSKQMCIGINLNIRWFP